MKIPVEDIIPNPKQPRRDFDPEALRILAESLDKHGQVQAITVEKRPDGGYQLIAGERRWRAAQLLEWEEIEATVSTVGKNGQADRSRLSLALIENLHREDMNAIERAQAYDELAATGLTNREIAETVCSSSSNVWLYRALTKFEPEIQEAYRDGKIPIDQGLVHKLRKLDPETRKEVVRRQLKAGITAASLKRACTRALNDKALDDGGRPEKYVPPDGVVPSVRLGARGGFKWQPAYQAAVHTCTTCDFFGSTSDEICKACPVVTMVEFMTRP